MIAQLHHAVLAFGSNQGDRAGTIRAAQEHLANTPGISDVATSPLRETIAVTPDGLDPDAPRYLNGVATLTTTLTAHDLHDITRRLEDEFGRVRHERWGDRTLDIDLIVFGGTVLKDEQLTVPHPRAHERDFVLAPWLDLEPDAVLIGHGRVAQLLAAIGDTTTPFEVEA